MARKRSVAKPAAATKAAPAGKAVPAAKATAAKPAPTRTGYARVKEILSASADDGAKAVDKAKRFWEESLEHFKEASIYGVRLIAPEQPGSCCASSRLLPNTYNEALRLEPASVSVSVPVSNAK